MGGSAGEPAFDPDAPITVEVLADLQAGLLDDDAAKHVRRRVREDEALARQLAGLDRVRRELAALSDDSPAAPEVPQAVTERVASALRTADSPAPRHAVRGTPVQPRAVVAAVGVLAAVAAVGIGTATLLRAPEANRSAEATAETLTVSRPASGFPLSAPALEDLLRQPPDLGPLADPQRRSSCLTGLGYSTTTPVLGATRIEAGGQPVVVLLVPGSAPRAVNALAVRPSCSSVDTGLLADTALNQP